MVDQSESPQIDVEKIKQDAIKAAQDALVAKLSGDKPKYSWEAEGKAAPSNYDELFSEVDKRVPKLTPEDIDKRVDERLKAEREAEAKQKTEVEQAKLKTIEDQRKQFDSEWYELVQEGKMPAVAPALQERINKGERLTKEEITADEGLKARLKLAELAQKKSAKLAFYEDYGKEPAGATAPVLGGRPAAPHTESTELTYEETAKNRKKLFGF